MSVSLNASKTYRYARDARMEKILEENGLDFSYDAIRASKLEINDVQFQTREDVINANKTLIKDYQVKYRNGVEFPAPVLVLIDGTYVVCCGKHRMKAAIGNKATYFENVIVVPFPSDPDAATAACKRLRTVSAVDNNQNGGRVSNARLLDLAVTDIMSDNGGPLNGWPKQKLVSNVLSRYPTVIDSTGVRHRIARQIVRAKASLAGLDIGDLSLVDCYELYQLASLEAFDELVAMVCEFEGKGLSNCLKKIRNEKLNSTQAIQRLRDFIDGFIPDKRSAMPAAAKLRLTVSGLMSLCGRVCKESDLTESEVAALEKKFDEAISIMGETIVSLKNGRC